MFSHTSRPRSRFLETSVRKHWFFLFFVFFSLVLFVFLWFLLVFQWFRVFFVGFYWFFNGFLWFYNGFEQFFFFRKGTPEVVPRGEKHWKTIEKTMIFLKIDVFILVFKWFLKALSLAPSSSRADQSRPHGTLSSPLRVHEQRHMSSAGAPEPADLRFRLVFLWFSFKDEVQKEAPERPRSRLRLVF